MSSEVKQQQEETCRGPGAVAIAGRTGRLLSFRPPRIAMVYLAIAAALHFLSPPGTVLFAPFPAVGAVLFALGFGLMMWSWVLFNRAQTAVCLPGETTILIRSRPYSFSRNPMYLGMVLMLTGAAFLLGSVVAFAAPAAFFFTLNEVFVPFEEEKMVRLFGEVYDDYRRRVRRWL